MMKSELRAKRLNWDSDFFGIEVGQIHLKNQSISDKEKEKFKLIYAHSDHPIKNLESICYDKKITFSKKLTKVPEITSSAPIKKYAGPLKKKLLQLAIESGNYSRFRLDPKLFPHFERLYTIWIENSLNGSFADHVFIYEKKNEILGFVTLIKKNGFHQIGLIATSSSHRGLGIGSALLKKVDQTVISEKGAEVRVITQLDNQIACNFYKKNGYTQHSVEYIYHLWS